MPSLNVQLEPGKTVTVRLEKAGYVTQEFSYTVPAIPATVTKKMVAQTGSLSVSSTPSGATVTISGVFGTFTTPFTKALDADTYSLTITKLGYKDKTDTVTIVAEEITMKHYTLELAAVTITFVTRKADGSILTGVDVFVDGDKKGIT